MWHWVWKDIHLALTGQWFGIPYGNFIGWATVVFCYSGCSRLFERWMTRNKSAGMGKASLIAALAVLSSLAVLISTEIILFPILLKRGMTSEIRLVLIVAALVALVVIGWPQRRRSEGIAATAGSVGARVVPRVLCELLLRVRLLSGKPMDHCGSCTQPATWNSHSPVSLLHSISDKNPRSWQACHKKFICLEGPIVLHFGNCSSTRTCRPRFRQRAIIESAP